MKYPSVRQAALSALLISASTLAACAHRDRPTEITLDTSPATEAVPAVAAPEPPARVEVVAIPEPLPLPGQLKPLEPARTGRDARAPTSRVTAANAAARMEPVREGFINAVQLYPFSPGALYQVYTAPGHVTDIALQEGERLVGTGPVAAGDTARWIIGDTLSGAGASARVHILVKPTRTDLRTNLIINTDRRTYLLELRATRATWMASVSWSYPADQLIAISKGTAVAADAEPIAGGIALDQLQFRYRIEGDRPPWRPLRAFDDGRQVYIEFPMGIAQGEMPPLFIVGRRRNAAELVNYRVRGRHMIVDRLFAAAELRLGAGRRQQRVRIERSDGRAARD
ncbi:P-type conjugative transfer protein TrbG [Sphingosinicella rhizophila]|uniref:P-type conjugative transfer protein TrbG n=1 Tax=Sphingosinicella rhizophila TaxID=3050082 RepID=A0ABU3QAI9_9SPHN|nr:P-type conjugative transfer protein TrbG [Sphingosinicella sp. GR2756]MDT9600398.1 P-type conjugative transfer protein TrbG [Sphingosinicella sp. GR2756]